MDVKSIVINMSLLSLFVISMMAFIITTQQDNAAPVQIVNDSIINRSYQNLQTSLEASELEKALDIFGQTTPTGILADVILITIMGPTRLIKTFILGMWDVYVMLPQEVLGVPEIVAQVLGIILLVLLVIGIWAIWKGVIK